MDRRQIAATGIWISRLGFGAGGAWASDMIAETHAVRMVHAAQDAGVNYFDTGPSYAHGTAELRLRSALKRTGGVVISTKVGTHAGPGGELVKDYTEKALRRSLVASLDRLGRSAVDILYLHGPIEHQQVTDDLVGTMRDLRDEGLAGAIGASCDGAVAEAVVDCGHFDVLMMTISPLNPSAYRLAERAKSVGMTVIAKSPLGHSAYRWARLLPTNRRDAWYLARLLRHYPRDLVRGLRFGPLLAAEAHGDAPVAALRLMLGQRFLDSAVIGTTQLGHLADLVAGAEAGPLDETVMERLAARQDRLFRGR